MRVKIFLCYAHADEQFLKNLRSHLSPLERQGFIDVWHDRDISAGIEWESEIKQHLNSADIILLLVSPDFIKSDYCYGIEMQRAIERHRQKEARVIPVILRPCLWQRTPLSKLQALPTDGVPITMWLNPDEAFLSVVSNIDNVIRELATQPLAALPAEHAEPIKPKQTNPSFTFRESMGPPTLSPSLKISNQRSNQSSHILDISSPKAQKQLPHLPTKYSLLNINRIICMSFLIVSLVAMYFIDQWARTNKNSDLSSWMLMLELIAYFALPFAWIATSRKK